jgi:phosphohistidine phosphatase
MKSIYFIRSAKAKDFSNVICDYERGVKKRGYKDIQTIGSYLNLRGITPDIILSSYALRAQQTAISLVETVNFKGKVNYLEELYYAPCEDMVKILMEQDEASESIFIIGHNPQLLELINTFSSEHINKLPSMGVVALSFDTQQWSELRRQNGGVVEFFIFPKQFKYYMPQQIRAILPR